MEDFPRFVVIFLVFILVSIPLLVYYFLYISPGLPDILTTSGVIVVLVLILVCNLLPKRTTRENDRADQIQ